MEPGMMSSGREDPVSRDAMSRNALMRGTLAFLLAFAIVLVLPAVEAAAAPPSGAAKPVEKYWDETVVRTRVAGLPQCIDLSPDGNPLGYGWKVTYYGGWSYIDANGVSYVTWFSDGSAGPYDIVEKVVSYDCGF